MVRDMLENIKMTNMMEKEFIVKKMEINMKDIGNKGKEMEVEFAI